MFSLLLTGNLLTLGYCGYKLTSEYDKSVIVLDIVNANFKISELITRNIRDYVIHGDQKYLDKFWETIAVRSGSEQWGKVLKAPWFEGKTETLSQLYDWADLNEDYRQYLENAINESVELIWNEIQAINWVNGRYDEDGKGRQQFDSMGRNKTLITFTTVGDPDRQKAIDILYSSEYLQTKARTEVYTQKAVKAIMARRYNITRSYKIIFYILLLIAIVLNGVLYARGCKS
jgi:adenylate cyclase